jgi:UDP:flavonoid glycosyltransferase YjiC (YdhE family)
MQNTNPCVIIAPLNWGLGHATRCIPLVNELIRQNCRVVLCGNGESLTLLSNEFPDLEKFELHNYVVRYSQSKKTFLLRMLFHLPAFFKSIRKDKKMAEIISKKIQPNLIISDNRYGFRCKNVFSVLLTHQLNPLLPPSLRMFQRMFTNRIFAMMRKFHQVWVPDYENEPNLSGILSHNTKFKGNVKFCGPLSRCNDNKSVFEKEFDIMCVISGPEPQKSIFENYCFTLAKESKFKFCIAAGKPREKDVL